MKKLVDGPAGSSYGIHAAQLAGIPANVIIRAEELLRNLEKMNPKKKNITEKDDTETLSLFDPSELIINEIQSVNINETTPIEALNILSRLKKQIP